MIAFAMIALDDTVPTALMVLVPSATQRPIEVDSGAQAVRAALHQRKFNLQQISLRVQLVEIR